MGMGVPKIGQILLILGTHEIQLHAHGMIMIFFGNAQSKSMIVLKCFSFFSPLLG
jgi:hypothetical protein